MSGIKRITGAADLAPEGEPGSWVSEAAREKFMAAYERPDDSPGLVCGLAGRASGQAQRPSGAPGGLLLRRLDRHEPGDPRTRPGRVHHAARPAGLTKLDARFRWWLSISGLVTLTPMPLRRRLARWLDNPAMLLPELMTLMWAAIQPTRQHRVRPQTGNGRPR